MGWRMADMESNWNFLNHGQHFNHRISPLLFRVKHSHLQKEPEALDYPCKTGQGFDLWGFVWHTFKWMKLNLDSKRKSKFDGWDIYPLFSLILRHHSPPFPFPPQKVIPPNALNQESIFQDQCGTIKPMICTLQGENWAAVALLWQVFGGFQGSYTHFIHDNRLFNAEQLSVMNEREHVLACRTTHKSKASLVK